MKSNKLQKLLDRHQHGWTLEQPFYLDNDIFNAELEAIWKKYWLFAGTIADIPKPGDYFLYKVHNDSIIIIRGNKGEVFAHYNTCRHRGSLICLEEKGRAPKLVCPYHQWVYDKDGSLVNARLMTEDFDKSEHGLHPVKVEVTGGFIFISLSENPPDFKKVANDYFPFLSPYKLENAKVAFKTSYELGTN